jgi:transposase
MKQIRRVLTIRLADCGRSIRMIAASTGVSRPVVAQYVNLAAESGLSLEELRTMDDAQLSARLGIERQAVQSTDVNQQLMRWAEVNISRLAKPNMTRRLLHEDYLRDHPDGLQYSQFCLILHAHFRDPDSSSLLEHKAGDKLYEDFTGQKASWTDRSGTNHTEEVFLSVLGASGHLFSLPVPSQSKEDFVHATQSAFQSYGGVPRAVVPDCLKSAVTANDGYEAKINGLFQNLLDHYGVICLPARPRHPRDKAHVEAAVNLIYRQILTRLGDEVFADRREFLAWWSTKVAEINVKSFQKLPGSRQSRFEELDKPALRPLPDQPFDLQQILKQTVSPTGVVYVPQDQTYYSVPHALTGKSVEILVFPQALEVWHEHARRATHDRQAGAGKVLRPEHRDNDHQWFADRNPEELARSFESSGVHLASWARKVLETSEHPDLAWSRLRGLKKLLHEYPGRIDTVCRLAHRRELYTLAVLRLILRQKEDLQLVASESLGLELGLHENVRGPSYWMTGGVGA